MRYSKQAYLLLLTVFIGFQIPTSAQPFILDRIVAVVGEHRIIQSDIENTYLQNKAQGVPMPASPKCFLLEDMLSQKLLVHQAEIDSIIISEGTVEMELAGRLSYFTSMIGSPEALEDYFGKSILEIKDDMRESVRESILTRQMQQNITQDVSVTPSEIKDFFENMPEDSIPYIDSKIEISQIVMYPEIDEETDFAVKQQLLDLRRRILEGENFKTLAVLYSEGPSAPQGGEIGFRGRGELDPAYTKAAFSLTEGGVSTIVESQFGYHIIQLIERRDDRVNTRHILMKPKINTEAIAATKRKLDSIARLIRLDTVSFELAARIYSQDKNTAVNGGTTVNPIDFTTKFKMDELQTSEFIALRDLNVGEITNAFQAVDEENGREVFKIVWLKSRTKAHRANLAEDYGVLQQMTLAKKKEEVFHDWLVEKIAETYVRIDDSFGACPFSKPGWIK